MRRLAPTTLLVAVVAVTPAAWSAGGWGAAANRACTRDFAAAHAYERRVGNDQTTKQGLEVLRLNLLAIARARADLARIPRPRAQATRIAKLLHALDLLLIDVRGMQRAVRAGDTAKLAGWGRSSKTHAEQANADSRALGASVCAGA